MKKSSMTLVNPCKYAFLILALSLTACGQEKGNKESQPTAQTESIAPDIDLNAAVMGGNLDAVQQHIKAGTDLNKKEALSGSTPLITAITFEKDEIADALIDAGADLSIKNNDGSTALHVAAFFCRVESVQKLIDAGADKTIKNNYGATARETITAPFEQMKPIYEMMQQQLAPVGLQIDIAEVEKTRPVIAMMLQ
ncbi:ankyrin repeat domain-containing protein [Euzebyella marina]|uniref:Ankyrin repeat domain-containing protein n=1 Tax=Euzebyella marina TaxID=1761453 RepID=A0A3G2L764_9FLAO|nr:ankyrin repeat domain-containing protein [Euzebyella marina]AYN68109.1 ankyrin repeat domain-containing protein [Euzebyella marina]